MWRAAARETEQECGPVSHLASSKKNKKKNSLARLSPWPLAELADEETSNYREIFPSEDAVLRSLVL